MEQKKRRHVGKRKEKKRKEKKRKEKKRKGVCLYVYISKVRNRDTS
jgi:hypothetical protein